MKNNYIITIIINGNGLEFEIICPVCQQRTLINNDEMIDCLLCGTEIPEYIDNVWKEFSEFSKDQVINLIKHKC